MVMKHYQHLEEGEEGEVFGLGLVLRRARERLVPILMTALTTGLALVPLVVAGNVPGHEVEHPMAVVILGGLITSILLNLFIVPPCTCALAGAVARPGTAPPPRGEPPGVAHGNHRVAPRHELRQGSDLDLHLPCRPESNLR